MIHNIGDLRMYLSRHPDCRIRFSEPKSNPGRNTAYIYEEKDIVKVALEKFTTEIPSMHEFYRLTRILELRKGK